MKGLALSQPRYQIEFEFMNDLVIHMSHSSNFQRELMFANELPARLSFVEPADIPILTVDGVEDPSIGVLDVRFLTCPHLLRGMKVRDDLYIGISTYYIPPDISVGGSVYIMQAPMVEYPEGLKVVNGDLNIIGTLMPKLPDNMVIKGDVCFERMVLRTIPNGLQVDGNLTIDTMRGENYVPFGDNITINGSLRIVGGSPFVLSDSLKVNGSIIVIRNNKVVVPESLQQQVVFL